MKVTSLRAYLVQIGMSLKDFAEMLDYSPVYLRKVLRTGEGVSYHLHQKVKTATDGVIELPIAPPKKRSREEKKKDMPKD